MVVRLTREERQRIAAKLRKAEIEKLSTYEYSVHLGEAIGECVRLVSGHEILVKRGLDRLADLIEYKERTCRWKHVEGTWFMSECGKRYDCIIPDNNFCPNCGAKAIGG